MFVVALGGLALVRYLGNRSPLFLQYPIIEDDTDEVTPMPTQKTQHRLEHRGLADALQSTNRAEKEVEAINCYVCSTIGHNKRTFGRDRGVAYVPMSSPEVQKCLIRMQTLIN